MQEDNESSSIGHYKAAGHEFLGSVWPEPDPIRPLLPELPKFDPSKMLPENLAMFVENISKFTRSSPEEVSTALLVALSSIAGMRVSVRPGTAGSIGEVTLAISSLCVGVVSGQQKLTDHIIQQTLLNLGAVDQYDTRIWSPVSPVNRAVIEAIGSLLKRDAGRLVERSNDVSSILRELNELLEASRNPSKDLKCVVAVDPTLKELTKLAKGPIHGLYVRREDFGENVLRSQLERSKERLIFKTARSAAERVDGTTTELCLVCWGRVSPDKLETAFTPRSVASGRAELDGQFDFLIFPSCSIEAYSRIRSAPFVLNDQVAYIEKLIDFNPLERGAHPPDRDSGLPFLTMSKECVEMFSHWKRLLYLKQIPRETSPCCMQLLLTAERLLLVFAGIFHCASGACGEIDTPSMRLAIKWVLLLYKHAQRAQFLLDTKILSAPDILSRHLTEGKLTDLFTSRDVSRRNWRGLHTESARAEALETLVSANWLKAEIVKHPEGGRGTFRYQINPKVKIAREFRAGQIEHGSDS